jgi:hypothetical protein
MLDKEGVKFQVTYAEKQGKNKKRFSRAQTERNEKETELDREQTARKPLHVVDY